VPQAQEIPKPINKTTWLKVAPFITIITTVRHHHAPNIGNPLLAGLKLHCTPPELQALSCSLPYPVNHDFLLMISHNCTNKCAQLNKLQYLNMQSINMHDLFVLP